MKKCENLTSFKYDYFKVFKYTKLTLSKLVIVYPHGHYVKNKKKSLRQPVYEEIQCYKIKNK